MNRILVSVAIALMSATAAFSYTVVANRYAGNGGGGGYDSFTDMVLVDNGFTVVGSTLASDTSGWLDMYVERVDMFGHTLWSRSYFNPYNDEVFGITEIDWGEYIVFGGNGGLGDGFADAFAARVSWWGNVDWFREYGQDGDDLFSAGLAYGGNVFLAGHTRMESFAESQMFLVKLNGDGQMLWRESFGGERDDQASFVLRGHAGNLLLGGYSRSGNSTSSDAYYVLTDNNGQMLNSYLHHNELATWYVDGETTDTGFLLVGTTFIDSTSEQPSTFIMEVNDAGNPVDLFLVEGAEPFWVKTMEVTPNGYFFLGGETWAGQQALMLRVGPGGQVLDQIRDTVPGADAINSLRYNRFTQVLHFAGRTCPTADSYYDFFRGHVYTQGFEQIPVANAKPAPVTIHPNPFNAASTVQFTLDYRSDVRMVVYDILGRETVRLLDEPMTAGRHTILMDGDRFASGVYFLVIDIDGQRQPVQRMVLVR